MFAKNVGRKMKNCDFCPRISTGTLYNHSAENKISNFCDRCFIMTKNIEYQAFTKICPFCDIECQNVREESSHPYEYKCSTCSFHYNGCDFQGHGESADFEIGKYSIRMVHEDSKYRFMYYIYIKVKGSNNTESCHDDFSKFGIKTLRELTENRIATVRIFS